MTQDDLPILHRQWLKLRAYDRQISFTLALVLLLAVVFLASETVAHATSFIRRLQPLLSFGITAATLAIGWVAGRSGPITRFWVLADIRYAGRRALAHRFGHRHVASRSGSTSRASLALYRETQQALQKYLWKSLSLPERDLKPADLLAHLQLLCSVPDPWRRHEVLKEILHQVAQPGAHAIIPRILYREEMAEVHTETDQLMRLLERDYPQGRGLTPPRSDFGTLLSAFTGSFVLCDGLNSRSGTLSRLVIHHSSTWVGEEPRLSGKDQSDDTRVTSPFSAPYELYHIAGECQVHPVSDDDTFIPGDYDGRVLNLMGSHSYVDTVNGEIVVTLDTADTCYRTTELSSVFKCKRLESVAASATEKPYVERPTGAATKIRTSRSLLLNTSLTLVSVSDEGRYLVLVSRGLAARNATGVLSAAAGGVFEHRRHRDEADTDELGVPDLELSVLREAKEELGIGLDAAHLTPFSVFLANIQGRPAGTPTNKIRNRGQLVATAGFIAITTLTASEIEHQRQLSADWVKGRFEVETLTFVEIPASSSSEETTATAIEYCKSLESDIRNLDINAILGALYVGAHFYGQENMACAIHHVFKRPWWALPWSDDDVHRLVIDPRSISTEPFTQAQTLPFPDAWISELETTFPS